MTKLADTLRPLLGNPNVQAFLRVLREGETSQEDRAYFMRWPGKTFDDLSQHPRIFEPGPNGPSSAAGAYQITYTTYAEFAPKLGVTDFSKPTQDLLALAIIDSEGALHDIYDGRIVDAINKLGGRWASLPSATYGQRTVKLDRLLKVYQQYGGKLTQASEPSLNSEASSAAGTPEPKPAPTPAKEGFNVKTALLALGAELLSMVPWVQKNQQQAEKVIPKLLEVAKEVYPQGNEQARVEAIQSDPALRQRFVAQVAVRWNDIAPFLEFEAKERKESRDFADRMTGTGPMWRQVGYGALVAILALGIVFGGAWMLREVYLMPNTSEETRGNIVGFLLAMIPVVVYWVFGSSRSSQVKDQALLDKQPQNPSH